MTTTGGIHDIILDLDDELMLPADDIRVRRLTTPPPPDDGGIDILYRNPLIDGRFGFEVGTKPATRNTAVETDIRRGLEEMEEAVIDQLDGAIIFDGQPFKSGVGQIPQEGGGGDYYISLCCALCGEETQSPPMDSDDIETHHDLVLMAMLKERRCCNQKI